KFSMSNTTCAGCGRTFPSIRGYQSHLRQTRDVLCRHVYNSIRRKQGVFESAETSEFASQNGAEDRMDVDAFEGDYFGGAAQYVGDDFGQDGNEAQPHQAPSNLEIMVEDSAGESDDEAD
ncbi:hypothetical protein BDN70DRAFT_788562, partial [Pholiota conissans]